MAALAGVAMLFDISDSRWHIGLEGVKKMATAYPDTPLILWHWGSADAPEWKDILKEIGEITWHFWGNS